jgi:putative ABC transport system permease protein
LRDVLERVAAILQQIGFGIRLVGGFTVLAGIAILGGAVSAGAVRRGRQVALYKTLGMTRAQVVAVFAVEYALIGLVAGTIGALGGTVMAWLVMRYGFELGWWWPLWPISAAITGTLLLSVAAGLAASAKALAVRPLAVLRQVE